MKPTIFVLVHPAWHGGWVWRKVSIRLRDRQHHVITPTLTGLGDRSHLARPDVGLDTHVTDVVSLLDFEDLHDVILVGHSSAGAVVTGVVDRVPQRIRHLVYLDAFVPQHGQSVFDLLPPERRKTLEDLARIEGAGWLLPRIAPPPWPAILRDMWAVTDDEDTRWMLERLTPTPLRHFSEPVTRTSEAAAAVARTYIRCRHYAHPRFDEHAEAARRTANWRYAELAAGHHPAVTAPDSLAALLTDVAG